MWHLRLLPFKRTAERWRKVHGGVYPNLVTKHLRIRRIVDMVKPSKNFTLEEIVPNAPSCFQEVILKLM